MVSEQRILKLAHKVVEKSSHDYAFHACIIVKGNRMIAFKANWDWTHAEARAIHSVKNPALLKGATVYSIRVSKNGEHFRNAKPCKACAKLIEECGARYVVHTDAEGDLIRVLVA